jgi:cytidylate kinase
LQKINIAIDGYSSCGKSTLAKALAKELSYVFIDTGAMYRAITYYAMQQGLLVDGELNTIALISALPQVDVYQSAENGKTETWLNDVNVEEEIRALDVSNQVSEVSKLAEVRKKLVALQQKMGENKGVVMDGRDIGTVVFTNADLKLFMTANHEVRTKRRFEEFKLRYDNITIEEVSENIKSRDYIDTHRANDPLRQAEDAIVIDNSYLSPVDQFEVAIELVNKALVKISSAV